MISVPFVVEAYEGLAQTEGVAQIEDETLELQFQTRDSFVGALKSELKRLVIKLEDLESVTFKRKLLGSWLIIRTHSMDLVNDMPGNRQGELSLHVARKHRDRAEAFCANVMFKLSEKTIERLGREIDGMK